MLLLNVRIGKSALLSTICESVHKIKKKNEKKMKKKEVKNRSFVSMYSGLWVCRIRASKEIADGNFDINLVAPLR